VMTERMWQKKVLSLTCWKTSLGAHFATPLSSYVGDNVGRGYRFVMTERIGWSLNRWVKNMGTGLL
jgi:hypothetical protein